MRHVYRLHKSISDATKVFSIIWLFEIFTNKLRGTNLKSNGKRLVIKQFLNL